MSASTSLGGLSKSLRQLLVGEMQPKVAVTLLRPDELDADQRVNLFMHRIEEHPQFRNADFHLRAGTTDVLDAPPLSLVVRYVLTAYATSHAETGLADAQALLGEAMRVFHQFPVVPDGYLDASLLGARERLRIALIPLGTDEIGQLWNTFSEPYRLSVQYEVSVVQVDSTPDAERTLAPRVREVGVPDVRAPYEPPAILDLQPRTAPAATELTITGVHLSTWRATVTMAGLLLAEDMALASDSFAVAVPPRLSPGFHQVTVDVSRLCRASFFVEVVT